MGSYSPLFTVTNRMLTLACSITEKAERLGGHGRLESLPQLKRESRIRSVGASLAIDGVELPAGEVQSILEGGEPSAAPEDILAVKNAYAAYEKLESIDPYDTEELKACHEIMTCGSTENAGRFRSVPEGVFAGGKCIFIAPPPGMVPGLTDALFRWMEKNRDTIHPLILSSVFHYELAYIHPFSSGSGRMARLWQKALLSRWNRVFETLPFESTIEASQREYYQTISDCYKSSNSDAFIEFLLEKINLALDDLKERTDRTAEETSLYVKKLLKVMTYDTPYTTAELLEALGLNSRETFRKNYMDPALKLGYTVMTVPDKPTSRNQRYIRIR